MRTKSETNGTAKPQETSPVSDAAALTIFCFVESTFDQIEAAFGRKGFACVLDQQVAAFVLILCFSYLFRMRT